MTDEMYQLLGRIPERLRGIVAEGSNSDTSRFPMTEGLELLLRLLGGSTNLAIDDLPHVESLFGTPTSHELAVLSALRWVLRRQDNDLSSFLVAVSDESSSTAFVRDLLLRLTAGREVLRAARALAEARGDDGALPEIGPYDLVKRLGGTDAAAQLAASSATPKGTLILSRRTKDATRVLRLRELVLPDVPLGEFTRLLQRAPVGVREMRRGEYVLLVEENPWLRDYTDWHGEDESR